MKKTNEEKIEAIEAILNELDESERVDIHNDYLADDEDRVHPMCDLDKLLSGWTPTDILKELRSIDPDDYWFKLGYDAESAYDAEDIMSYSVEEMAIYAVEHDEDFDINDITAVLDDAEDEMLTADIKEVLAGISDTDLISLMNSKADDYDFERDGNIVTRIYYTLAADLALANISAWALVKSAHDPLNHFCVTDPYLAVRTDTSTGDTTISTMETLQPSREDEDLINWLAADRDRADRFLVAHR